jgi:hypothetical protein
MSDWNGWPKFAAVLHRVDRQQELLEAALVAAPKLPIEEPPHQAGCFCNRRFERARRLISLFSMRDNEVGS